MYNLIAYVIYTGFVLTVVLYVGHFCYKNGAVYLARAIPEDLALAQWINKILLVGYYLLNIGLGIYLISTWGRLHDFQGVLISTCRQISNLLFVLGIMHYINLFSISLYSKKLKF